MKTRYALLTALLCGCVEPAWAQPRAVGPVDAGAGDARARLRSDRALRRRLIRVLESMTGPPDPERCLLCGPPNEEPGVGVLTSLAADRGRARAAADARHGDAAGR